MKYKTTVIMGIALLVSWDPLTMRMAQGLIRLMAPTRTRPTRIARRVVAFSLPAISAHQPAKGLGLEWGRQQLFQVPDIRVCPLQG